MPTDQRSRLAGIRRFDQLVAYLRDELGWPIASDDFEELTFEYTPGELGIDPKNAAKIQEIRRLRPLATGQPWGIFFVKFEPKRLPVVALLRILGLVTLKKRATDNWSERQAWAADDLLFVSNFGEGEEHRIAFAHFSTPLAGNDLPTLKVLGWDNLDTPLHLDAVAHELTTHLAWPDDEEDIDSWREHWRSAFGLRHREVVTTSKQLSGHLAELARAIRDRTLAALAIENESGALTKLLNAFQTTLVHDLDEAKFADMYAQTIAYGLLSARITDPTRRRADDLAIHMRTNPFLRKLMEAFLRVGGRGGAGGPDIDFDELGVSEVVDLLDRANMEAVVRDFGDRNPKEDPVIHFYEHFLAAYDKQQKVRRGVFYTPRPVVSYIVRSVHETLQSEFGLADGLADTATWGEMSERHETGVEKPKGVSPEQAFVQILDPATGTGTFLVEVIDLIHDTMSAKWRSQGHGERAVRARWNEYVPKHLLPRLHGYELLMAPYAIAHLKIGLKLYETGYRFESEERARVYLTNALEPPRGDEQFALDLLPALAQEAAAVNEIKQRQRFTVVIGNPPYLGEAGRGGEWIASLMRGVELPSKRKTLSYFEVDGKPLGEKNPKWLNDLYVRFTRLSQHLIERSGTGVHGFITNHSYIDNPTFRGMRWALLSAFDHLVLVDLHGNLKKKEVAPDGSRDENVFDIEQGVAIGLFAKAFPEEEGSGVSAPRVHHSDLWGARAGKYVRLLEGDATAWAEVEARPEFFLLKPFSGDETAEYDEWASVTEIFPVRSVGIVTARDALTVQWSKREIWEVVREVAEGAEDAVRARYRLRDVQDWKVAWAQRDLRRSGPSDEKVAPILYRPFDTRSTYYTGTSRGFLCRPRADVMPHMLAGENRAICIGRAGQVIGSGEWDVVSACSSPTDFNLFRRGGNCLFPLYLYAGVGRSGELLLSPWPEGKDGRRPNLDPSFVERLARVSRLDFVAEGRGDLLANFGPEDLLAYIYAVFHSPSYRDRYDAHLKLDFPRVPPSANVGLFRDLARAGHALLALHVLESPRLDHPLTNYSGPKNPEVSRVGWSDGTVWLNAAKTIAREGHRATKPGTAGFRGVPEEVWNFRVGGYQVCHKWLKDRKGRRLSDEDLAHYEKIVVALGETVRIMAEVDQAIEDHGGWPNAFETESDHAEERPAAR
ncbi:MAG: DNA methyltransferase [Acidobacteria bacterium]|nr:DNA methyltransferase [Acidobacteriota bacterium]